MRDAWTRHLLLPMLLASCVAAAQITPGQRSGNIQISGVIRLQGRPAPQGVLVLLDVAPTRDQAVAGAGELDRTVTDSSGRFLFSNLSGIGTGSTKLFSVTVRFPGYQEAFQVVDLTFSNHGYVNLDLKRDTSRDPINVPPEGAGATISAHQPATDEARDALARGEKLLLEKRDPGASVEDFKKVVKSDPKFAPGFLFLGTAYIQIQSWQEAQSAFEKAAKLEPSNAEAYLGVGTAMNGRQDFSGAQTALLRSVELNPASAEAQYELSKSLWALGKWQEAEPHVRKALEINKTFPLPHILMGNIYLRHRDANSALSEFQEYLRLDPQGAQAPAVREMVAKIQKALGQR